MDHADPPLLQKQTRPVLPLERLCQSRSGAVAAGLAGAVLLCAVLALGRLSTLNNFHYFSFTAYFSFILGFAINKANGSDFQEPEDTCEATLLACLMAASSILLLFLYQHFIPFQLTIALASLLLQAKAAVYSGEGQNERLLLSAAVLACTLSLSLFLTDFTLTFGLALAPFWTAASLLKLKQARTAQQSTTRLMFFANFKLVILFPLLYLAFGLPQVQPLRQYFICLMASTLLLAASWLLLCSFRILLAEQVLLLAIAAAVAAKPKITVATALVLAMTGWWLFRRYCRD